jgi:hypothetical protein
MVSPTILARHREGFECHFQDAATTMRPLSKCWLTLRASFCKSGVNMYERMASGSSDFLVLACPGGVDVL